MLTCRNLICSSSSSSNYVSWFTRAKKSISSSSKEPVPFDLLHRSELRTEHFQASLPRLPVPKLEDSVRRYLASQRALLDDSEFEKTSSAAKHFLKEDGSQLQRQLQSFNAANKHTSYVTDFWFDMYLRDRASIVLNCNPCIVFVEERDHKLATQDIRATNAIVSSMRFQRTYAKGLLAPEVFHIDASKSDTAGFRRAVKFVPNSLAFYVAALLYKAYPLDMSQFPNLFNSTRIPKLGKDVLVTQSSAKHLLVMRNGHFYVFDVLDDSGAIVDPKIILANIRNILADNRAPSEFPVGVLTADERDLWTMQRQRLLDLGNAANIDAIDGAAFVLCLDDKASLSYEDICHTFLHGDAGLNRWFDKSFSLILQDGGRGGLNFEHSWGDGVAVLRFINELHRDSNERPSILPATDTHGIPSSVRRLEWQLDNAMRYQIKSSMAQLKERTSGLDLHVAKIEGCGKKQVKRAKLSPDAIMQLAFQRTYYKLSGGQRAATYESCSTSAFKRGRTETVRSGTCETAAFCRLLDVNGVSRADLLTTLKASSDKHNTLVKEAAMGQGWDRHLFVLRHFAEKNGILPDIFADPAYKRICHIILSTSTLSSPAVDAGAFAPVTPDGFGVAYGIFDDYLGVNVTGYRANGSNVNSFGDAFRESIREIFAVIDDK